MILSENESHNGVSLNETVASNLRHLREKLGLSRPALAEQLTQRTGEPWSQWRVIDLEGARSATVPPRPATWPELVALALELKVKVFDLVLPPEDGPPVNVWSTAGESVEPHAAGETFVALTLEEFAAITFGMPAKYLNQKWLGNHQAQENGLSFKLETLSRDHDELINLLTRVSQQLSNLATSQEATDGINS